MDSFLDVITKSLADPNKIAITLKSDNSCIETTVSPISKIVVGTILYEIDWKTCELTPLKVSLSKKPVNSFGLCCMDFESFPNDIFMSIMCTKLNTLKINGHSYKLQILSDKVNEVPEGTQVLYRVI